MSNFTITYNKKAEGFPSFFSYIPEFMVGLNNRFYSFDEGNLYVHDSDDVPRGQFYGNESVLFKLSGVFNQSPLENKLFKTIAIEGSEAWDLSMYTDVGNNGGVLGSNLEKKEQSWFGFIRNENLGDDLLLRNAQGVGAVSTVTSLGGGFYTYEFTFAVSSMISIGDVIYQDDGVTLSKAGLVTAVSADRTIVTVELVVFGVAASNGDFVMYIKDKVAESYGLLGHYAVFTIINETTTASELFILRTEIMKSFP